MAFERMDAATFRAKWISGEISFAKPPGARKGAGAKRRGMRLVQADAHGVGASLPAGAASGAATRRVPANGDYEEDLQRACFDWIFAHESVYPVLRWAFHSPNGGRRSKAEAGKFKAMGVRKGVVDIICPFPSGCAAGLALELKRPGRAADVTADQALFLAESHRNGYVTGVCTTLDEFFARMAQFLGAPAVVQPKLEKARGGCVHG